MPRQLKPTRVCREIQRLPPNWGDSLKDPSPAAERKDVEMQKRLVRLSLALVLGVMTITSFGCTTNSQRSTIFSSGYWKRHFENFAEDLHQFRVDIDRTIFDLEDRPIEEQ